MGLTSKRRKPGHGLRGLRETYILLDKNGPHNTPGLYSCQHQSFLASKIRREIFRINESPRNVQLARASLHKPAVLRIDLHEWRAVTRCGATGGSADFDNHRQVVSAIDC